MSWQNAPEPVCDERRGAVSLVIEPRVRDLGGFSVRRVLPAAERRAVGPFVFFDEMGPTRFASGAGIDVRPHPHIGLSTVTFLFEGEIVHRDSLGVVQAIRPGEVNLMTAGRGVVHSERTDAAQRASGPRLHGSVVDGAARWPRRDRTRVRAPSCGVAARRPRSPAPACA
jgi:redox-sensitive bicupin YhaK (pirin superfamily)